jgi:hypothetical protein
MKAKGFSLGYFMDKLQNWQVLQISLFTESFDGQIFNLGTTKFSKEYFSVRWPSRIHCRFIRNIALEIENTLSDENDSFENWISISSDHLLTMLQDVKRRNKLFRNRQMTRIYLVPRLKKWKRDRGSRHS